MSDDIRKYAALGLVHHMLYPETMADPAEHARTLAEFAKRTDIDTFDCCLPYDAEQAAVAAAAVQASGKRGITFVTHLFPARKLSFSSLPYYEQAQIRSLMAELIRHAVLLKASGFIFPSGGPPHDEAAPAHFEAFSGFCRWLCGELKPHGITVMLEPFDFTIDKKFLYGPTQKCAELIESLKPEVDNMAIELDMAHLPLMGESFEDAIRVAAPHLARVHLGNCILRDTTHPRYGDTHPPIGFPGGEIDVPELALILRCLREVGFLDARNRGNLVVEMTPWPGKTVEETVADAWRRVHEAWAMV